jgi:hypothetical protein
MAAVGSPFSYHYAAQSLTEVRASLFANGPPPIIIRNDDITERDADYQHITLQIISTSYYFCVDPDDSEHRGGAIETAFCNVSIEDSDFLMCVADIGGACYFRFSTVFVETTNFSTNFAEDTGAVCFDYCQIKIAGGASELNDALSTGCFSFINCNGTVANYILFHNVAHQEETGGACLHGSPIEFIRCSFIHNHVEDGWAGAASIYDSHGVTIFTWCTFISNEVIEWRDTHIFVSGASTILYLNGCQFDSPEEAESILLMLENDRVPVVTKRDVKFGAKIFNPYLDIVQNDSVEYLYAFKHASSDIFALTIFVAVPVFIVMVWVVLDARI